MDALGALERSERTENRVVPVGRPPSAAAAIGSDALIGNPHALWQLAALPEHVDGHAAVLHDARHVVGAHHLPDRLDLLETLRRGAPHLIVEIHRAHVVVGAQVLLRRGPFEAHRPRGGAPWEPLGAKPPSPVHEALRRAQPLTLFARFAPRQRENQMNELLAERQRKPELDAAGSLIDADMGAYYTWLNQQRLPGAEKSAFLAWHEDHSEAVVIAPHFELATRSDTPIELRDLIARIA